MFKTAPRNRGGMSGTKSDNCLDRGMGVLKVNQGWDKINTTRIKASTIGVGDQHG